MYALYNVWSGFITKLQEVKLVKEKEKSQKSREVVTSFAISLRKIPQGLIPPSNSILFVALAPLGLPAVLHVGV